MTTSQNASLTTVLGDWTDGHGVARPLIGWTAPPGWRAISTAVVGGGIGPIAHWLNVKVDKNYDHPDPVAHCHELAHEQFGATAYDGTADNGTARGSVVMLTAADITRFTTGHDCGVSVVATVGLGRPVWPAAQAVSPDRWPEGPGSPQFAGPGPGFAAADTGFAGPGTINVLVVVPVPLSDAALVNAVVTATEAKSQALVEFALPGTGTASDAICIACPATPSVAGRAEVETYGGPRSPWGAAIARAVHAAVVAGTRDWLTIHPPGDPHRMW
jgi:adenosylcobinamide hydrolase